MDKIDWKKIKFVARADTWFDEGTVAELDGDVFDMKYTSAIFNGIKYGKENGEVCSIFEFDWIDECGNILNSNVPDFDFILAHDNYIVENGDTGEKYDYLNNVKL
jgi:hypothetical protein